MLAAHAAIEKRLLHLGDIDGGDEHVVADRRQQTVGQVEHARLLLGRQRQHPADQWAEQLLLMNHRDHGEKHHQQRGERHGVLEGTA
ncbi:hypothetical protein D3C81_1910510 [compost metagenome]